MDNRPVGIFDSGLGGLSGVKEFIRMLPGENMVYFGDTGRVPYGNRGEETIIRYALQDAAFLTSKNVKAIIIACGTVSSVAGDVLKTKVGCPLFEVVSPTAAAAAAATKNGKVGIIGTAATINSGKLSNAIKGLIPGASVSSRSCPLFVPIVETGHIGVDDPLLGLLMEEYLAGFKNTGVDTLVLGCTHYPLLAGAIDQFFDGRVTLINSGLEVANQAAAYLKKNNMLSSQQAGEHSYFVSDSPKGFSGIAELFMGRKIESEISQVTIAQIEQGAQF